MKPLIKRRDSILYGYFVWQCSGNGSMGMGLTPKDAYYDWLLWEKNRGRAQ